MSRVQVIDWKDSVQGSVGFRLDLRRVQVTDE